MLQDLVNSARLLNASQRNACIVDPRVQQPVENCDGKTHFHQPGTSYSQTSRAMSGQEILLENLPSMVACII